MKYRDLDIFFKKNADTGDISFVSNNSSIIQSIKNIVLTRKGERPFNNYFGTGTVDLLFDNPSPVDIAFLQKDIKTILEEIEPRIIVDSVEVLYPLDDTSEADAKINIKYKLNNGQQNFLTQTLVLTV
jgi:phage baseplate assembly protein W